MSEGPGWIPERLAPGSRVGNYVLAEQIGQGGMATVFRAHDQKLGRDVALKILAPVLAADEAFRQRFIRESRAAAAVDDPNIIPVFEAGESAGVLFIAMRFIRGSDLRSLLFREGVLPPYRVAGIVAAIASALDAAHAHGLIHRDVKPGNMMLEELPGRGDHVYLSDFGLSKEALGSVGLTGTGQFLGTVDYAAPEQIAGGAVDGRADQYALGCSAFEMLCGQSPFRRDQGMAVLYAHLSEPAPLLTSRNPALPAALDEVFAKVLAKAPQDRYPSCAAFGAALRGALDLATGPAPAPAPVPADPATELSWSRPAGPAGGDVTRGPVVQGTVAPAGGDVTQGPVAPMAGSGSAPAGSWPLAAAAWPGPDPRPGAPDGGPAFPGPLGTVPYQGPPPGRAGAPRWLIPIAAAAVAAAVVAVTFAVIAFSGRTTNGTAGGSPPASGVSAPGAGGPFSSQAGTGSPQAGGSSALAPSVTPVTSAPASSGASVPVVTVPGDIWIAQLAAIPFSSGAAARDARLASVRQQVPGAQVVSSADYASLTPGYWMVYYNGTFGSGTDAVNFCFARGLGTNNQCFGAYLSHSRLDRAHRCYPSAPGAPGCYGP